MPRSAICLVLDTNVVLRGLANTRSASGIILGAADQNVVALLLSKPILAEYHAVLTDPEVAEKFPSLSPENVDVVLRRLRYIGELRRGVRPVFKYSRDPLDQKFVDLAVAGRATHIVTADRDLLSLSESHGDAAKWVRRRLPALRILHPTSFLESDGLKIGLI